MKLEQPVKGYRYSIDAFLLAFFASRFQSEAVVEIGCGCGVVSLLMAARSSNFSSFELYEIQPELCRFAKQNVAANPMPGRSFTVRCEDVRYALPGLKPGLVVCNPPFRDPKTGRISANRQRAVARNWFFLPPPALFDTFLRMRGDESAGLCLVLPAGNFPEWLAAARGAGLFVTDRVFVHSFADRGASLILVRVSGYGNPVSKEHLVLYEKDGENTEIVKEIMDEI